MKRLTTDDSKSILCGLNLFFAKDGEVWIRGGGPEPDYQDCTLVDYIVRAAETHHLNIVSRDVENLGDEMYDCLQYGTEELEGVVALLHAAAVQAAEMRGRLAPIEDILGDSYDLDRLQELVKADRDGRCEIHKVKDGETVYSIFAYVNDLCPKRSNGKPFNPIAQYTVENFTRNTVDREFGKTVFLSYEAAEAALSDWNGGAV